MSELQEMAASLARIEAQGRSTHHRLDEQREDFIRHMGEDDVRFELLSERITKGRVKQGWFLGCGVGAVAFVSWIKDHLTF
ncbi:MAG: hypothetical protein V3S55_03875 [Nitrospiraceae bacterium]